MKAVAGIIIDYISTDITICLILCRPSKRFSPPMLCCFPSLVRANFLGSATATTFKCRGISSCTVSEDSFKGRLSHTYLHAFGVDRRKIRVVFSSVTGSHHDHTHRWRHSGSGQQTILDRENQLCSELLWNPDSNLSLLTVHRTNHHVSSAHRTLP